MSRENAVIYRVLLAELARLLLMEDDVADNVEWPGVDPVILQKVLDEVGRFEAKYREKSRTVIEGMVVGVGAGDTGNGLVVRGNYATDGIDLPCRSDIVLSDPALAKFHYGQRVRVTVEVVEWTPGKSPE